MAPTLGKRKRITREELERPSKSLSPSSASEQSDNEDLQAIFRRAFESKFKPLHVEPKKPKIKEVEIEEEGEDEESDWSGISDDEDQIEVFDHTESRQKDNQASKAEKRAFMSSKPPTSTTPTSTTPTTAANSRKLATNSSTADDQTESTNLKNDLALQKLLRDSHILSAAASSSNSGTSTPTSLSATGAARHKSTDLHLQSLGARNSIFTQKKMPMSQRKHMAEKARLKEGRRRAEAREAGVVLEKEKKERKIVGKRERGVGGPSIGRFKGGTLTLSKQDVRSITRGSGGGAKGKGKGKKGRR